MKGYSLLCICCCVFASVSGCSVDSTRKGGGVVMPKEGELCFRTSAADNLRPLGGVEISMVDAAGSLTLLGATQAQNGRLCIDKRDIIAPHYSVVVFCKKKFFCGAMLANAQEEKEFLLRFSELSIALSRKRKVGYDPAAVDDGCFGVFSARNRRPIPGVRVLNGQSGWSVIGFTDKDGGFCMEGGSGVGGYPVIFCRDGFFCSALLDDAEMDSGSSVYMSHFVLH